MEKSSLENFRLLCIENLWKFLFWVFIFSCILFLFVGKSNFKGIFLHQNPSTPFHFHVLKLPLILATAIT